MNKFFIFFSLFLAVIFFVLLFSPFISLILPIKFTEHTYYRIIYRVIAEEETKGCLNNESKVLKLFAYIINHEFMQGEPYKCKPFESLVYGEAFCDFQARTFNALLAAAGITSRQVFLFSKDKISPHTLNEVLLDKKWCVFDPALNIIHPNAKGGFFSLEDLSFDPGLIYGNRKFAAMKEYDKVEYDGYVRTFSVLFPLPVEPTRSIPVIQQTHIFDHIADGYPKIFGYRFSNFYQDLYLNFKKNYNGRDDFRLFFMARNYHLSYRTELASKHYRILLDKYPQSDYAQDAIFFSGMLYFEQKDFSKSAEFFKVIIDKYPQKWDNAAYYYLGMIYDILGNQEMSLSMFRKVSFEKLSAAILDELNKKKLPK